jgi:hypothetical protein
MQANLIRFPFNGNFCIYRFVIGTGNNRFGCAEQFFGRFIVLVACQHPDHFQIHGFHFGLRMFLIVADLPVIEHAPVGHALQLQQCRGFVPAYFGKIVWACTMQRHTLGIGVVVNTNFIPALVHIVLNPENNMVQQWVVINGINIAGKMNFFTASEYLVACIIVNMFNKV